MSADLHPVIRLLIARMESHPDEFRSDYVGRWSSFIEEIREHAVGTDREVFDAAYSKVMLDRAHERVMDELLNGEERRAEEVRRREEEKRQYMAQTQNLYANNLQNAIQQHPSGLGIAQSQPLGLGTGGNEAMRFTSSGELRLGKEVLTSSILRTIKKKLGI